MQPRGGNRCGQREERPIGRRAGRRARREIEEVNHASQPGCRGVPHLEQYAQAALRTLQVWSDPLGAETPDCRQLACNGCRLRP